MEVFGGLPHSIEIVKIPIVSWALLPEPERGAGALADHEMLQEWIAALFEQTPDSGAERAFDGEEELLHLRSLVPWKDKQMHVIGHVDERNEPVSIATDCAVDAA